MKILIATDGTRHSQQAIEKVADFKLNIGDEIKIISVVDMAVPVSIDMYGGYMAPTSDIENNVREAAENILEGSKNFILGLLETTEISVNTEILYGSPDSRIVETSEKMKADLIIVGSHGYNRWERFLLGSVSDSVIRYAKCSVLVVRTLSDHE